MKIPLFFVSQGLRKDFEALRKLYGTHERAAEAVGYKRAQYQAFRLGERHIPKRAALAIETAARMARASEETTVACPDHPLSRASERPEARV